MSKEIQESPPRSAATDQEALDDDSIVAIGRNTTHTAQSEPKQPLGGDKFALDLKCAETNGHAPNSSAARAETEANQTVVVVFELPDGSRSEQTFQLGQTVEVLKAYAESEFGIPMATQELYLDDQRMMDPLSLGDYPSIVADLQQEVYVLVEGEMGDEAKK